VSLRINLKAHEKIIIGKTLIVNGDTKSSFVIEGDDVPILRERFILSEKNVKTPVQRLYFLVQLMYVSGDAEPYRKDYFSMVDDVSTAAPSFFPALMAVTDLVRDESYYAALRALQAILERESELLSLAVQSPAP